MRDILKPIPLDDFGFLKNFRGEVTIELKDVKTGEVETVHDHNLVTKALAYFLKQGGITNPSAFNASDLRTDFLTNMLGGVLCLDTAITDAGGHDDEIVRVPAGVKMTANGAMGVGNNSAPTEFGSYNNDESGWQQDGSFKMVWDYTTSQANGTIATVCLTSYFGGYAGIGNRISKVAKSGNKSISNYNSTWSKGYSGQYLGIYNNTLHAVRMVQGVSEWTVDVYAFPTTDTDVRDNLSARLIDTYTVSIPAAIQNLPIFYNYGSVYIGSGFTPVIMNSYQDGNNCYLIIGAWYSGYGALGIETFEVTYNIATHTVTGVVDLNSTFPIATLETYKNIGISNKWVIAGNKAVEFANLANTVDIEPNAGQDASRACAVGQDIFYTAGTMTDMVLEERNPINGNGIIETRGAVGNNPILQATGATIARDPRYIATIFNLDSPKTKSADKTMKVSYVLRFNEEE